MKSKILLLLCSFICIKPSFGQKNIGPKLVAMGHTGAAIPDVWSVNANPSLITEIETFIAAVNYQKPLVDVAIGNQAGGLIYPLQKSAIGVYCYRYGFEDYSEIQASAILSKKFGDVLSFATRGNYHQIKITDYGTTSAFSIDLGLSFFPSPAIKVGFYVDNINFGKYHTLSLSAEIPTIFYGGVSYTFSDRIIIGSNINYENTDIAQTLGIEYKITNVLSIRGGLTSRPIEKYVGFGIKLKKMTIDVAITRTAFLSYTPQIGFSYAL